MAGCKASDIVWNGAYAISGSRHNSYELCFCFSSLALRLGPCSLRLLYTPQ